MINKITQYISDYGIDSFKKQCYFYSEKHEYSCILDSCSLNTGVDSGKYEFLAAFGAEYVVSEYQTFKQATTEQDWLFGILSYDLKDNIENLKSSNRKVLNTPPLLFFKPKILIAINKKAEVELLIQGNLDNELLNQDPTPTKVQKLYHRKKSISKEAYLSQIKNIHDLIKDGEVYELNYCLSFEHEIEQFDPIQFHIDLLKKSPVPMASYLKANKLFLCGASMERFIAKSGTKLLSQPIKGTIKKGSTFKEDEELIAQLENSEKDRAENVMIVDLVRNDLVKVCVPGTIKVNELFGIYSYLQVHQMISTITGQIRDNIKFDDILKATFPMGSMTGAPKISAMQHIDRLENFRRGWYSGAVGYIAPTGDFDFNVVIRTLFCDFSLNTLSYCAGGAITIDSNPEKEWEEILLKTKAITDILGS